MTCVSVCKEFHTFEDPQTEDYDSIDCKRNNEDSYLSDSDTSVSTYDSYDSGHNGNGDYFSTFPKYLGCISLQDFNDLSKSYNVKKRARTRISYFRNE